jgi:hypothetical protein
MWSVEAGNNNGENREFLIENSPAGHAIKVDVNQMVESVFISPKAKPWFLDIVKDVLSKYGFDKLPIQQSDFDLSPPT